MKTEIELLVYQAKQQVPGYAHLEQMHNSPYDFILCLKAIHERNRAINSCSEQIRRRVVAEKRVAELQERNSRENRFSIGETIG